MIDRSSMRMIDEDSSKKIENECWSEKAEDYVANCSANSKSFV